MELSPSVGSILFLFTPPPHRPPAFLRTRPRLCRQFNGESPAKLSASSTSPSHYSTAHGYRPVDDARRSSRLAQTSQYHANNAGLAFPAEPKYRALTLRNRVTQQILVFINRASVRFSAPPLLPDGLGELHVFFLLSAHLKTEFCLSNARRRRRHRYQNPTRRSSSFCRTQPLPTAHHGPSLPQETCFMAMGLLTAGARELNFESGPFGDSRGLSGPCFGAAVSFLIHRETMRFCPAASGEQLWTQACVGRSALALRFPPLGPSWLLFKCLARRLVDGHIVLVRRRSAVVDAVVCKDFAPRRAANSLGLRPSLASARCRCRSSTVLILFPQRRRAASGKSPRRQGCVVVVSWGPFQGFCPAASGAQLGLQTYVDGDPPSRCFSEHSLRPSFPLQVNPALGKAPSLLGTLQR
uniref:Uncharacterized protein n=1 Tax=Mycena chlorophos TaxID=658473 RepID=A0ABQ0L475_MYCCL|nr:predicted protein [Mycena chlorophos]